MPPKSFTLLCLILIAGCVSEVQDPARSIDHPANPKATAAAPPPAAAPGAPATAPHSHGGHH